MINNVMTSIPGLANEEVIRKALIENHGNCNNAVSYLLDLQYSSNPSTPGSLSPSNSDGSISIQRESDGETDESDGPNKRQNRRTDRAMKALPKKKCQPEERKPELDVIPTIELTQPDAEKANHVSSEILQPTPLKPAHKLAKDNASVGASDEDDEFKPEDSASEYDVSSRSPSFNPANPRPRAKIILNNNRKKAGKVTKQTSATQTCQTPHVSSQSSQDAQNPKKSQGPKTRIPARQRKEDKKLAQKQAAKERKRNKNEGSQLTPSTSNIKRVSPPMEKVLCVQNMIVA
jgi:hypothetical protein